MAVVYRENAKKCEQKGILQHDNAREKTVALPPIVCYNRIRQTEYRSTPDGRKRRTEAIHKAWEGFI